MALDISAVRQALATAAATTGIASVTFLAEAIEVPLFEVGEVSIEFDTPAEYLDTLSFICRLYVSVASDSGSQPDLDRFMERAGLYSIKTALESDRSLAGTCKGMRVMKVDGYRVYQVATIRYLGAQFAVTVMG